MPIKKDLGINIKKIRKNRKLTQEEFAEMINIAPRTLSGIECGENFVTAETLDKIVVALDTTQEELFSVVPTISEEQLCDEIIKTLQNRTIERDTLEIIYRILKK